MSDGQVPAQGGAAPVTPPPADTPAGGGQVPPPAAAPMGGATTPPPAGGM